MTRAVCSRTEILSQPSRNNRLILLPDLQTIQNAGSVQRPNDAINLQKSKIDFENLLLPVTGRGNKDRNFSFSLNALIAFIAVSSFITGIDISIRIKSG